MFLAGHLLDYWKVYIGIPGLFIAGTLAASHLLPAFLLAGACVAFLIAQLNELKGLVK